MDLAHQMMSSGYGADFSDSEEESPPVDPFMSPGYSVPGLEVVDGNAISQEQRDSQRRVSFTYDLDDDDEMATELRKLQQQHSTSMSPLPGTIPALTAGNSNSSSSSGVMLITADAVDDDFEDDDVKDESTQSTSDLSPVEALGPGTKRQASTESTDERYQRYSRILESHGLIDHSIEDDNDDGQALGGTQTVHVTSESMIYSGSQDLSTLKVVYDENDSLSASVSLASGGSVEQKPSSGPQMEKKKDLEMKSKEVISESVSSLPLAAKSGAIVPIATETATATRGSLEEDDLHMPVVWLKQDDVWQLQGAAIELFASEDLDMTVLNSARKTDSKGWNSVFGRGVLCHSHCRAHGIAAIEWTLSVDDLKGRRNDVVIGLSQACFIGTLEQKKHMRSHIAANFSRYSQGFGFDNKGIVFNQKQATGMALTGCQFTGGDHVVLRIETGVKADGGGDDAEDEEDEDEKSSGTSEKSKYFWKMCCRVYDPFKSATNGIGEEEKVGSDSDTKLKEQMKAEETYEWTTVFEKMPTVDSETGLEIEYRLAAAMWTSMDVLSIASCRMSLSVASDSIADASDGTVSCFARLSDTTVAQLQPDAFEQGIAQRRARSRSRTVGELRTKVRSMEDQRKEFDDERKQFDKRESEYLSRISDLEKELAKAKTAAVTPVASGSEASLEPAESTDIKERDVAEEELAGGRSTYVHSLSSQLTTAESRLRESEKKRRALEAEVERAIVSKLELIKRSTAEMDSLRQRIHELCTAQVYSRPLRDY